jgi:hypothetical protein
VFALYGEWGSGKTSVKNLLKEELAAQGDKGPILIEFNPWAFSGQDQVLEAFFSEVGKTLGRDPNGKKAAEGFKKLGAYLSFGAKTAKTIHLGLDLFGIPGAKLVGMVGEKLEGGSKDAKEYGNQFDTLGQTSLEQVQRDLKDALGKFHRPLLIVVDDLDRLTPDQLLTVFQIVKLNANLPRVNYLLLMDAKTITDRLKHKELGPEFIEKIIQFELERVGPRILALSAFPFIAPPLPLEKVPVNHHRLNQFPESPRIMTFFRILKIKRSRLRRGFRLHLIMARRADAARKAKMAGIARIDQPHKHNHGFFVRVQRAGNVFGAEARVPQSQTVGHSRSTRRLAEHGMRALNYESKNERYTA